MRPEEARAFAFLNGLTDQHIREILIGVLVMHFRQDIAEEREACAKVADEKAAWFECSGECGETIAKAIRARQ